MSTVTVYVKLVSGSLLALEVPPRLPSMDLYTVVFQAFPQQDRPDSLYALQLLRINQEEGKSDFFLFPFSSNLVDVMQEECLSVLVQDPSYHVYLEYLGDADAMEKDMQLYERYGLSVSCNDTIIYQKHFYQTPYSHLLTKGGNPTFYLIGPGARDDVEGSHTGDGFYFTDPAILPAENTQELFSLLAVGPITLQTLHQDLQFCIQREYTAWRGILQCHWGGALDPEEQE